MEYVVSNIITITPRALTKLHELNQSAQKLRVAVVGGGCSGLSYKLSFIDEADEKDSVFLVEHVFIVVDPKSALFVKGMELDHTDGLEGVGFVFNNPNAKRSCGCGSSFST
jgi:iron-sulfur cluster assembly protein